MFPIDSALLKELKSTTFREVSQLKVKVRCHGINIPYTLHYALGCTIAGIIDTSFTRYKTMMCFKVKQYERMNTIWKLQAAKHIVVAIGILRILISKKKRVVQAIWSCRQPAVSEDYSNIRQTATSGTATHSHDVTVPSPDPRRVRYGEVLAEIANELVLLRDGYLITDLIRLSRCETVKMFSLDFIYFSFLFLSCTPYTILHNK